MFAHGVLHQKSGTGHKKLEKIRVRSKLIKLLRGTSKTPSLLAFSALTEARSRRRPKTELNLSLRHVGVLVGYDFRFGEVPASIRLRYHHQFGAKNRLGFGLPAY
ncbi:hypothetical protein [Halomonas sp. Y3]|uniref:hypothetical protein n=1 Tax=Halomonas sp. Y3 TaxID=2956797 RepID=UPI00209CACB0|nr:hypothetical protein [Halomonas sp. Y3]